MYYRRTSGSRFGVLARRHRFGNKGGRGGFAAIKSFDPTMVIGRSVEVRPPEEYVAKHSFADYQIDSTLKCNIALKGYLTPTPIQDQVIDPILEGRDLIGKANTGTGKTAAFLIPLIDKVIKDRRQRILIVAPTRELADQIVAEFREFSKSLNIYSALCIGGANINRQINDLRRSPSFVIGTPGRILDLVRNRILNLSTFGTVVLDEADHMVDIGFINDVKTILSFLNPNRQSLFFSATIGDKVKDIIARFVNNPVSVSVDSGDTTANIEQKIIKVDSSRRVEVLHELLIRKEFEKVLIFGRTKHGVQHLSDELFRRGHKVGVIHGNKKQNQRTKILENFRHNYINILVATDVASRGLDIPNVSHIINFDLPESYEAYIHRIGRTGRADKKGTALTFVG